VGVAAVSRARDSEDSDRKKIEEVNRALERDANGEGDAVLTEAIERTDVMLTWRGYESLKAVERYRATVERAELYPEELKWENFHFSIVHRETPPLLAKEEVGRCVKVTLFARQRPGEDLATEQCVGPSATYIVCGPDFEVARSFLPKKLKKRPTCPRVQGGPRQRP
jgi:hypothetical protein